MRFPGSVPLRGILFLFSAHASTKPATASGRDQLKRKIVMLACGNCPGLPRTRCRGQFERAATFVLLK
jgi:hypothetical protein